MKDDDEIGTRALLREHAWFVLTYVVGLLMGVVLGVMAMSVAARSHALEQRAAAHCHAIAERIRRDLREPSDAIHRDLVELIAGDEIYVCLGRTIALEQASDAVDDLRRLP